jgi:(1->4)-alpha-D-glucan 1-alpha-D-glucosylmutase
MPMPVTPSAPAPSTRIPRATYRFQFNERFRLRDALALVPGLNELGISHIYASPLFKACPHSTHGYDVCDYNELNPEIGMETDLAELAAALREHGMGLVLDIVPNHMGIGVPENRWWWDVLTWGQSSPYAEYFDIDWESPDPDLRDKVLAPVLSDGYERELERGAFAIADHAGELVLCYGDHLFPLTPSSLPEPLAEIRRQPEAADGAAEALRQLNADTAGLDAIIRRQHYRLACWHEGAGRLNYRRFFNVNTLAGLRMEDKGVFFDSHALLCAWLKQGWVDGLRVDHPDGLRDPGQYLRRLHGLAPGAWIVVEKILSSQESLPAAWPVAGSTGYDFMNRVNGLFVDPRGERPLFDFYAEFTGKTSEFATVRHEKKCLVLKEMFVPEVERLCEMLSQIAATHVRFRNRGKEELRDAMIELAASLPVYRTYVRDQEGAVGKADVAWIERAEAAARQRRPDIDPELFGFLRDLLLVRLRGQREAEFVARFQQLTGAATAKGVEDTAFYCFNRLMSLNEVGGDPGRFGLEPDAFHDFCRCQHAHWPNSMLGTTTHDTKRSEDVRARLNLLSEIPERWREAVLRWSAMNTRHRRNEWPDRDIEYLLYQTLVGAWPLPLERALAYMEKAAREARQHTSWAQRIPAYDAALMRFVTAVMDDPEFQGDLQHFVEPLLEAGQVNSLAQTLIKLTAPGVPDFYQGCDLWDLSLVDPDNRRPVDFQLRTRLLQEMRTLNAEETWQRRDTGLPKMWLIRQALTLRRNRPGLFDGSSRHETLPVHGVKANHAFVFFRTGGVITVAPRLVLGLAGDWVDTSVEIPRGNWRNELTGEDVAAGPAYVAALLRKFPVALLARKDNG